MTDLQLKWVKPHNTINIDVSHNMRSYHIFTSKVTIISDTTDSKNSDNNINSGNHTYPTPSPVSCCPLMSPFDYTLQRKISATICWVILSIHLFRVSHSLSSCSMEICSQTDQHTDLYVYHNTPLPYRWHSNKTLSLTNSTDNRTWGIVILKYKQWHNSFKNKKAIKYVLVSETWQCKRIRQWKYICALRISKLKCKYIKLNAYAGCSFPFFRSLSYQEDYNRVCDTWPVQCQTRDVASFSRLPWGIPKPCPGVASATAKI